MMSTPAKKTSRKALFWIILLLLPALFFLLLEGLVRIAGLGTEYPLFIPVPNQAGYLQPNPDVVKRYFSRPELAPKVSSDTLYFLAQKPSDALRIVILGESSAAGFPYGRFGSPSGMLEQRLKPLYPEKNIEIINVAMAAINSYTLRDFTSEILAIKPDIVLIYTGHNEYLGVMGVGSALAARSGRWQTLSYIALRHSHLFQVFDSALAGLRMPKTTESPASDRTLMATVAADKEIAIDSAEYRQGVYQFHANMKDILDAYRAAGVPVVVGTLASNERDQLPFASQDRNDATLQAEIKKIESALQSGDYTTANRSLQTALAAHPNSADLHYWQAKAYEFIEAFPDASREYVRAKDLDLLRFRAPEDINQIIFELAAGDGVYLADTQRKLRDQSPHHIIGSSMMLEHLHPTADGYFWLSEAFFQTMLDRKLLPQPGFTLTAEQAINWKPLTPIDDIYAGWTIAKLTSDYPFTTTPKQFELGVLDSPAKEFAAARYLGKSNWIETTQKAFERYQQDKNSHVALILVGQLSDALPMSSDAAKVAGELSLDLNLSQLGLFYAERGLRQAPKSEALLMLKAHALFMAKRLPESKKILQQVISINPQHPMATEFLKEPWATALE